MNLDSSILLFLQNQVRNPVLDSFFLFITTLGNAGMIWIALSFILLFSKKTRKAGVMGFCALLLTLLINNLLIKNVVGRTRPYEVVRGLVPLIKKQMGASFPSGHSACAFAAASVFYRTLPKKYGIMALVLAVLISFSRLYVGVHYPSDVLVGMINGVLLSYASEELVNRMKEFYELHRLNS
ncbi:MAG: phosphatase PAP2 family protein, partial [Clostridiales bacterium]|nr:phosphatase PAP2 family protein [Clostridiales bacterium]